MATCADRGRQRGQVVTRLDWGCATRYTFLSDQVLQTQKAQEVLLEWQQAGWLAYRQPQLGASGVIDKLNQWLTLAANVGVLIGIGFLAYEIRQNTDSIHSQTRATLFAGAQEELWKNMEYPDVTINIVDSAKEITLEERVRLDAWLTAAMRAKEYSWTEYQNGNVDEYHWRNDLEVVRIILSSKRTQHWWTSIARSTFRPDFADVVDDALSNLAPNEYVEQVLELQ